MKKTKVRGKMSSEASSSSHSNHRGETVVADCGVCKSSCGYCKSTGRTSITHGLWAYSTTVDDYQDLLDRGWRRSGSFLYKPDMERTCCPSYTIRLRACDFVPSKEQRRVYRRMQRYLDGTLETEKPAELTENAKTSIDACSGRTIEGSSGSEKDSGSCNIKGKNKVEFFFNHLSDQINNAVNMCVDRGEFPSGVQFPTASVKKVSQAKRKVLVEGTENLIFTSNIAFQIAASLRRGQSDEKDAQQRKVPKISSDDDGLSPKIIAEKLASSLNQPAMTSELSIKACNGHLNFYSEMEPSSFSDDVRTEEFGRQPKNKSCSLNKTSKQTPETKHTLEIRLKRSRFDPEEFALYRRYQIKVHNDSPDHVTEASYRRFLVDTPLVFVPSTGDGKVAPHGFGSFHQQYLIDGRIVAVGVIDILPRCVSSKYLFWDPDLAFLSLGKYSALQEINWVKENQAHCPSLQYYYLGYYIHSCSKMRYKAAYRPSELLCPLRYQWIPYDIARPLLDRKRYIVLSDYPSLQKEDSLLPRDSGGAMDLHDNDVGGDSNDVLVDYDEEPSEPESDSNDDYSETETNDLAAAGTEDVDVSNILLGGNGSRVRYKDVQGAFDPMQRRNLESQLRKYQRVVGPELSERMVYSLG